MVSPYLPGFGSPAFQGLSVFLGILLSLGSTAAIANIVAGAALTYMRPFNVGDRVKIAETTGDVLEKTLLVTRIRTIKNVEVTIPNSMVLGSHMINFSTEAGVEIMSPTYSALRDGNQATIPEDYLPKTYEAKSFRILPVENLLNLKNPSPPK
jgi:small-conductance mechanosensitive channel